MAAEGLFMCMWSFMCVCCESLIKYFACRNLEHTLCRASEPCVSPSFMRKAVSWMVSIYSGLWRLSSMPSSFRRLNFPWLKSFSASEMRYLTTPNVTTQLMKTNQCESEATISLLLASIYVCHNFLTFVVVVLVSPIIIIINLFKAVESLTVNVTDTACLLRLFFSLLKTH